MAQQISRPFGVTIVWLLILLTGVLGLLAGILILFNRNADNTAGLWYGLVTILISVIYLLVARGIANGSRVSRLIVGALTLLSLVGGIWIAITASGSRITGLVQAGLALIILFMLYNRRAGEFFRG